MTRYRHFVLMGKREEKKKKKKKTQQNNGHALIDHFRYIKIQLGSEG